MKKLCLLLCSLFFMASCGFEVVDDGYVGVKTSMGKVDKEEYLPGVHFYNPLTTGISEKTIREQSLSGKLSSYSEDNQVIEVEYVLNYRPEATMVAELYVDKGNDYVQVILPQRVVGAVKEVLGKYKATDLTQLRAKVNSQIKESLTQKLEGTHIILENFEITNFDYDDSFEAAVRAKVVAKERAIEEQNRTVQIKEQATQKEISAKAEANAVKILAEALSKNKDLVNLKAVEKWDGKLPQYMLGDSTPFLNIK